MKTVKLNLYYYDEETPDNKAEGIKLSIIDAGKKEDAIVIPVMIMTCGCLIPAYYHIKNKHFFLLGTKSTVQWVDPLAWCIPPHSEQVKPLNMAAWFNALGAENEN